MSTLFNAIDNSWLVFAAAVLVGFTCMTLVALVLGMWEEMHR